jgi:hypothetical protein
MSFGIKILHKKIKVSGRLEKLAPAGLGKEMVVI